MTCTIATDRPVQGCEMSPHLFSLVAAARLLRAARDLLPGRSDRVPLGAVRIEPLALRVAGGAVAREVVERVPVEGHLHLAVAASHGLERGCRHLAGARDLCGGGGQRRALRPPRP